MGSIPTKRINLYEVSHMKVEVEHDRPIEVPVGLERVGNGWYKCAACDPGDIVWLKEGNVLIQFNKEYIGHTVISGTSYLRKVVPFKGTLTIQCP